MDKSLFIPHNMPLSRSTLYQISTNVQQMNEAVRILCVAEGNLQISCKSFSWNLQENDVILLSNPISYALLPFEKSIILQTDIDPLFFYEQLVQDLMFPECNSILHPEINYDSIRAALSRLAIDYVNYTTDNHTLLKMDLYGLLHQIKADCIHVPNQMMASSASRISADKKLARFESFIKSRYGYPITLQDAADFMGYTPQYLSNFIKKNYDQTFLTFLNNHRLEMSLYYLKFYDIPFFQISALCGFSSLPAYEKSFQARYLMTPGDYRKNYKERPLSANEGIAVFRDTSFISDYLRTHFSYYTESPAIIHEPEENPVSADVKDAVLLRPSWKELLNLGPVACFANSEYRKQLVEIQKKIAFRYGRLSDLLSAAFSFQSRKQSARFDFSFVFNVLDFLLSIGLKPFLDLGDKSTTLHKPTGAAYQGSPAENDRIFPALISSFLKACITRYGVQEVSTWKFELWMRYEHDILPLQPETADSYVHRYKIFAGIMRELVPDAMIGAPGFNSFFPFDLLEQVLCRLKAEGEIPDFLSIYIYPYTTLELTEKGRMAPPRIPKDPDFFQERLQNVKALLNRCGMPGLPVYVTEFSGYIGFRNHLNDSMFQGVYITKQVLDSLPYADAFGYWLASDFSMSFDQRDTLLFGGHGLFSTQGIRKTGYYAYFLLKMLGGKLLKHDRHYIITAGAPDTYQVLLFNYAHFTPEFCNDPQMHSLQKYSDAVFENRSPYRLQLKIKGTESGTYRYARYALNADNGSVFHEWSRLGFRSDLTRDELTLLARKSSPMMQFGEIQSDGTIKIIETVERNEIVFLHLEKDYSLEN